LPSNFEFHKKKNSLWWKLFFPGFKRKKQQFQVEKVHDRLDSWEALNKSHKEKLDTTSSPQGLESLHRVLWVLPKENSSSWKFFGSTILWRNFFEVFFFLTAGNFPGQLEVSPENSTVWKYFELNCKNWHSFSSCTDSKSIENFYNHQELTWISKKKL